MTHERPRRASNGDVADWSVDQAAAEARAAADRQAELAREVAESLLRSAIVLERSAELADRVLARRMRRPDDGDPRGRIVRARSAARRSRALADRLA